MKQPIYILDNGTRVRTHKKLGKTTGFLVVMKHIEARKPDAPGVIDGIVGGHGGDVYWVRHGQDVAAYSFSEFELEKTT